MIKKNSSTHLLLSYLKVTSSKYSSIQDIKNFSPHKFKDKSKIKKSLQLLIDYGFVVSENECYNITQRGIDALNYIVLQKQTVDK